MKRTNSNIFKIDIKSSTIRLEDGRWIISEETKEGIEEIDYTSILEELSCMDNLVWSISRKETEEE